MRLFSSIAVFLALPLAALAQERPQAILVLDGSGSMWGQIDGVAKITIAQDVVGELLGSLPDEQELGLTVYGHRQKGDCSDIETVVMPGAGTRGAIADAVNAIKPKGKTPMTDAVVAAAEALRYTEERATVILVSDGIETCEPDPCAAARLLEETGVDFTAHVVGFDVADDPQALAQMQCLADETGGTFRSAENAEELAAALVVVAEPPAPEQVAVRFRGIAGPGGPEIGDPLIWTITGDTALADSEAAPSLTFELLPGQFQVEALWPEYEEYVELTALVDGQTREVTLVFPAPPPPPVRVNFHATDGKNGPRITDGLEWIVHKVDDPAGTPMITGYFNLELERGEYRVTVTRPIDGATIEDVFGVGSVQKNVHLALPEYRPAATIEGPATAPVGSLVDLRWSGPDQKNDLISISELDGLPGSYVTYAYTREGPLLQIEMPPIPGKYELRYILRDGNKTLVSVPIEATPVEAVLTAPESAPAGAQIEVTWTGPDYKNDFITMAAPGTKDAEYINYTYTREGTPLMLEMPTEVGTYEIRYTMSSGRTVIGRRTIIATALSTTLDAPETAPAGSDIVVNWVGGDYKNDYIAFARPGDRDGTSVTYTYTREGSPLTIAAPLETGTWELRYVLSQDKKTAATKMIELTPVSSMLEVAATAVAGQTIKVEWDGPDYKNDYISVARIGEADTKYDHYTYTREGTPLELQMPIAPGEYEVRYTANGSPDTVLARKTVSISPVSASLQAPSEAKIGQTLKVTWDGPDYRNDYVSIARVGDSKYETYTYTREGTPLEIEAPELPGTYEIRYVVSQGRTVIATAPLVVSE